MCSVRMTLLLGTRRTFQRTSYSAGPGRWQPYAPRSWSSQPPAPGAPGAAAPMRRNGSSHEAVGRCAATAHIPIIQVSEASLAKLPLRGW